jgi:cyclophilin family peptidyl-prolyl cis-trans isomerase
MGMIRRRNCVAPAPRLRESVVLRPSSVFGRFLSLTALLAGGAALLWAASARADSFVEFDYNIFSSTRARGTVFIELFDDRPLTEANFLQYVNGGLYNDTLMHRLAFDPNTSAPFVLQGGGYYPSYLTLPDPLDIALNPNAVVDLDGNSSTPNPTVQNEFLNTPFRTNGPGTLAMAKLGNDPNSASNQFFFNLGDNSSNLDNQNGGFTVFGQVVGDGMSLINAYADGLGVIDMNPDYDNDGVRDSQYPFAELPALIGGGNFLPLVLNQAKVVDYLGSGLTTTVPASGLTFANKDAFIDTGTVITGTGSITIGVGRTLGIREGYTLSVPLINHGNLAPGLELGAITVASNYFQFSDGTLSIELDGTTPDTQYDKLNVTNGTAFIAGQLKVTTIGSYAPALGNSYTVLSAQSIIGNFGTYNLPNLTAGEAWKITQTLTALSLTVVEGDYNHDGVINADDYVVWRKQLGKTGLTPYSGADGNGDGVVNNADFLVWRNNIGAIGGGVHTAGALSAGGLSAGNVPEPMSVVIGIIACLFVGSLPRRRHSA